MSDGTALTQQRSSLIGTNLILIGLGGMLLIGTMLLLSVFSSANASGRAELLPTLVSADGKALPLPNDIVVVQAPPAQALPVGDQLRAAVERANQAFIEARGQSNASPLQPVATGNWLAQEQNYIAGIRARGQTERWRLVRLEYLQVEPRSPTTGFVCTRETWEVTTLGPGSAVGATRTYTFQEGYDLVFNGTSWVVTNITVGQG